MGQGMSSGGFSPFDIYFQYIPEGETIPDPEVIEAYDPKAVPCYESISVNILLINSFEKVVLHLVYLFRTRVGHALALIVPVVAQNLNRGHRCQSHGLSALCTVSLSSCWWSSFQYRLPFWWLFSGNGTSIESVSQCSKSKIACDGLRRHFFVGPINSQRLWDNGSTSKTWSKIDMLCFQKDTDRWHNCGTWLTLPTHTKKSLISSGIKYSHIYYILVVYVAGLLSVFKTSYYYIFFFFLNLKGYLSGFVCLGLQPFNKGWKQL